MITTIKHLDLNFKPQRHGGMEVPDKEPEEISLCDSVPPWFESPSGIENLNRRFPEDQRVTRWPWHPEDWFLLGFGFGAATMAVLVLICSH